MSKEKDKKKLNARQKKIKRRQLRMKFIAGFVILVMVASLVVFTLSGNNSRIQETPDYVTEEMEQFIKKYDCDFLMMIKTTNITNTLECNNPVIVEMLFQDVERLDDLYCFFDSNTKEHLINCKPNDVKIW